MADNDQMLEAKFKELLQQYSMLTDQGFGVYTVNVAGMTEAQLIALHRKRLEESIDAFKLAYLSIIELTDYEVLEFTERDSHAMAFKHSVQIDFPIPEGAFILAALAAGYTIREYYLDVHVYFDAPPSLGADKNEEGGD
jgi:hypothetical protein